MIDYQKRILALLFGLVLLPTSAWSSDEAVRNQIERIKLSLRQAALVETMTSAACLKMGGVDADTASNSALDDLDTYATVLTAFRSGHEWLGVLPENDPAMLTRLTALDRVWAQYHPAVEQLVAGDYHTVVVAQLLTENARISEASQTLAGAYIAHYGSDKINPDLGRSLEFAARHLMLSQRIIKEMCFVHFGIGGTAMPSALRQSIAAFDAGFADLSEGTKDVPSPPNARVTRNLRTAALFWKKMKAVADPLASGETVSTTDLQKALKMNKSVLKQLNQALESYLVGT